MFGIDGKRLNEQIEEFLGYVKEMVKLLAEIKASNERQEHAFDAWKEVNKDKNK